MPTVPETEYRPTIQEASDTPTPYHRLDVKSDAFGVNIGHAIEGMGGAISKDGDEIFNRAIALQNLQNETNSREGTTQAANRIGMRQADYLSTEGSAAVSGQKPFYDDVSSIIKEERDKLPNDAARKLYDAQSATYLRSAVISGAHHSATEMRKWATKTGAAQRDSWNSEVLQDPDNEQLYNQRMADIENNIRSDPTIVNYGEEQTQREIGNARSYLAAHRITGMARTNPIRANEMLKDAIDNHLLKGGQTMENVIRSVNNGLVQQGSRGIGDAVSAGWAPYMKQSEIDRSVGVADPLVRIVKQAQRDNPDIQFTIGDKGGKRSQAEQDALFAQGRPGGTKGPVVTWTRDSDHLRGTAVDLNPIEGSKTSYGQIEAAMKAASEKLGIPLGDVSAVRAKGDLAHFALPKDYNIASAPKEVPEGLESQVKRVEAWTGEKYADNSQMRDITVNRVRSKFNIAASEKRDADYTNTNTINGALVGAFNPGGKLPSNEEELRALDPRVAAAWDGLDETHRKKVYSDMARIAKGDVGASAEGLRQYQRLKGMAEGDDAERSQFLDTDAVGLKMPMAWRKELINLQQKKLKESSADPAVTKVMGNISPIVEPILQNEKDVDNRNNMKAEFRGAVQDQLQEFVKAHGKPMPLKDQQDMAKRLVQERVYDKGTFWDSKAPFFHVPVPDKEFKEISQRPEWGQLGITPDDSDQFKSMVQRIYVRDLYNRLYGGAVKKAED